MKRAAVGAVALLALFATTGCSTVFDAVRAANGGGVNIGFKPGPDDGTTIARAVARCADGTSALGNFVGGEQPGDSIAFCGTLHGGMVDFGYQRF